MNDCLIALGSNQGSSDDILRQACVELTSRGVRVTRISEFLRTRPVGKDAGSEFVNAAARAETSLSPDETLKTLHEVEALLGRRRIIHWGPRTLDLDLILFNAIVLNEPSITLPHPAMWYRHFVLKPAAEVGGEMIHPILQLSVQALFQRISRRPLYIGVPGNHEILLAAEQALSQIRALQVKSSEETSISLVVDNCPAENVFLQVVIRPEQIGESGLRGEGTPLFQLGLPQQLPISETPQWFRDLFLAVLG